MPQSSVPPNFVFIDIPSGIILVDPLNKQCGSYSEEGPCEVQDQTCSWSSTFKSCGLKPDLWVGGYLPAFSIGAIPSSLILVWSTINLLRDIRGMLIALYILLSVCTLLSAMIVSLASDAGAVLGIPSAYTIVCLICTCLSFPALAFNNQS